MHLGRVAPQTLCERMRGLFASEFIEEHPGYQGRSSGNDTCLFMVSSPVLRGGSGRP